jgi:hypothetical protein
VLFWSGALKKEALGIFVWKYGTTCLSSCFHQFPWWLKLRSWWSVRHSQLLIGDGHWSCEVSHPVFPQGLPRSESAASSHQDACHFSDHGIGMG